MANLKLKSPTVKPPTTDPVKESFEKAANWGMKQQNITSFIAKLYVENDKTIVETVLRSSSGENFVKKIIRKLPELKQKPSDEIIAMTLYLMAKRSLNPL